MIKLYSGTPGSGKSLHLARDIYYDLNRKYDRIVICNFPVDVSQVKHPERFYYIPNCNLKPAIVVKLAMNHFKGRQIKENDVCLYIDECQIIFNARSWNEDGRKEWLEFFSQHRKYGVFCVLIAQFDEMIDKQIRRLIEYETLHRKITNFGFFGLLIKGLTFGDTFIAIDTWYTIKQKVGSELFKAHKKYYSLYNTFDTFTASSGGDNRLDLPENNAGVIWDLSDSVSETV